MPKTIYLVRHGETDFNTDPVPRVRGRIPVPLNETGLRHANQAGEFLKDEKITTIYYSAVNRAKQTAEAVHKYHPEAKFVEEPLVLDISWGDWEGKTYEEKNPSHRQIGREGRQSGEGHPAGGAAQAGRPQRLCPGVLPAGH